MAKGSKKMEMGMGMGWSGMMWLHVLAFTLLFVGGLNWGLFGLFNVNLVHMILGSWPVVESVVYILVGLSAIYIIVTHKNDCKMCSKWM
jgi:uncharacterized membrane protein YuzA (DUF378 family)